MSILTGFALGTVASIALAVAAGHVGAVPFRAGQRVLTHQPDDPWRIGYFLALVALAVAWLLVLRTARAAVVSVRHLQFAAAAWALPLAVCAPLASRDVWAYAGQGRVLARGLDPYVHGPDAVPGAFLHQVAVPYRATASPYGPAWLELSRWAGSLGGGPQAAAVLLKLVAAAGFALAVLALPRLARAAGGEPVAALALVALNPLVLVIGVGGGHNDLVMTGLAAAALWVAARFGPAPSALVAAGVLATLAVGVKLPAVVVLAFVPLVAGRVRLVRSCVVVLLAAAASAAIVTVLTGLAHGWYPPVNRTTAGAVWLSVPVLVVLLVKYVRGDANASLDVVSAHEQAGVGRVALAVAAVVLPALWWAGRRRPVFAMLALALLAATLLSSTVLPWYAIAPLLAGSCVPALQRRALPVAVASVALTLAVQPDGVYVLQRTTVAALVAVAATLGWVVLRRSARSAGDP